jgi:putative transposase
MPSNLEYAEIRELKILPRNGQFYAEFIYKTIAIKAGIDLEKALGIDHGIDNWLTCVSNAGTSFIIDQEFLDGTRHVIYPWNQSKIENLKSSSPRIYPWGQSKI